MSGMAIVLLCAMQVDDSGWRTNPPVAGATVPGNNPNPGVAPLPSVNPSNSGSGSVIRAIEQADQVLRDGFNQVQNMFAPPNSAGGSGYGASGSSVPGRPESSTAVSPNYADPAGRGMPSASGSVLGPGGSVSTGAWPEVERALSNSAGQLQGSTTAQDDNWRQRMRGSSSVTTSPPLPPSGAGGNSLNSRTWPPDPRTATPTVPAGQQGPAGIGFPATRSGLGGNTEPAQGSFPSAVDTRSRVGQAFPRAQSSVIESINANEQRGREIVFEGPLPDQDRANRRYITPPGSATDAAPYRDQTMPPLSSSQAPAVEREGRFNLPVPPETQPRREAKPNGEGPSGETKADRPWVPLLLTLLGLFGSLGFNFYLGWIAWDLYSRYQDAVDDVQDLESKLEAKQQELASTLSHPRVPTRPSMTISG